MAQDIVSDALNQIINSKAVGKNEIKIKRISKTLINIFEMMKKKGHLDYEVVDEKDGKPYVVVKLLKVNECRAIKPRYYTSVKDINKYLRRFLPSRKFGSLVISTNLGLLDQNEAEEKNLGGTLIAYFY